MPQNTSNADLTYKTKCVAVFCIRVIKNEGDLTCLHENEGVIVHITVIMNIGLHTPVVIKFLKQRMFVEEAAKIAAHVVVRLPASIQHPIIFHGLPSLRSRL